jgi:hypothetical protein
LRESQRIAREARRRDEQALRDAEEERQRRAATAERNRALNERIKNKTDALFAKNPSDRRLNEIAGATARAEQFRNLLLQEHQRANVQRLYEEIGRDIRDFYIPPNPDEPDIDLGRDPVTGLRKIKRGDSIVFD